MLRDFLIIMLQLHRSVALKPLKAHLAWTDGVIDQIVYRLYELTAEEIAVVEGVNG